MWFIELDKKYKCMHVNLVERGHVVGEAEFLFVPYSTFTVHCLYWHVLFTFVGLGEACGLGGETNLDEATPNIS